MNDHTIYVVVAQTPQVKNLVYKKVSGEWEVFQTHVLWEAQDYRDMCTQCENNPNSALKYYVGKVVLMEDI